MNGDLIRQTFLEFFRSRGHTVMPSSSLVPAGDPTLLFTSAGMVPFKPFFMGESTPPSQRLTSSQKSFRTTDVDEVGDHKHLTFFEMLGNFSIGDYFKKEAIAWSWEFVTQHFKLSPERLYVTIYLDDEEAFRHWNQDIGVPPERIYRYGDKDNWWGPAGNEGPCGPCSEIHYDGGVEYGCGSPECHPNHDCERFVELWNLVFMQLYQDQERNRTPLPAPSIDTGMGLERAAAILQDKRNLYETDLFWPIIQEVCQLTGKTYGADRDTDYALRVVAEHSRAVAFLIADGVVPGNEGRGYVLRRIIRRAIRYGRRLGLEEPFFTEVAESAIRRFQHVYPELSTNRDFIMRVVGLEEDRFSQTFERGIGILEDLLASLEAEAPQGQTAACVPGRDTFILYDTYGFPPELTAEIAREHGLTVDMEGFEAEMEAQRERARAAHAFTGAMEVLPTYENLGVGGIEFVGYESLARESVVAALLVEDTPTGHAAKGQKVEVVLRGTPFYAEGGGQVGDAGVITGPNGRVRVEDSQSPVAGLIVHRGIVEEGDISLGETVEARVDSMRRMDTARNHSGTHMLHAALRQVLGPHVRQAGSLVTPDRLRFDYSHISSLSRDELMDVQGLVSRKVRDNLTVSTRESSFTRAVQEGALAFFGDRYGDVVRVVEMSDQPTAGGDRFSLEVCGGTHVISTGQIGPLFVLGESGIGGGMRRIEAVTGRAAEELFAERTSMLESISNKLQTPLGDLEERLDSFIRESDQLRKRVAALERESLRREAQELLSRVQDVEGMKVLAVQTSAGSADAMREMGDWLKARLSSGVIVLAAVHNDRPTIIAMVTPDLVLRGLHAGNIAKETASVVEGGGGGRPEIAQAGGRRADKLGEALQRVSEVVRKGVGS
ncbi:MAG: alanine--tRNA ligase [Dehalococcoidia bacterium]|nr:alanine--tRNA ligase [Dehalococcoidia bacterium]